jgi:glycerol-3-phosphate O-acyltransferase
MLYLVEKKGFYRRFVQKKRDHLQHLIEIQKTIEVPIFIIPQLMFFSTNPHRSIPRLTDLLFGTEETPGRIRRIVTLFKNPGKVFVEVSEPLNLKDFIATPAMCDHTDEFQALALRRQLIHQINRHRQTIIGPILKSREELKEDILTSHRLQKHMEQHAKTRDIPLYKVHKKADAYLDEIAANYKPLFVRIAASVIKWLMNTMFDGVTVNYDVLNKAKNLSKRGPLIFVPCHKSHIDYLILPYVLYHYNMPAPHVVAGKNLSFWPMGPLFRSGGAFFIRRSFKGAVLYAKVFSEYVYKLLQEGFNIKIFIEGGRSRTGKLVLPKLGFLSILLNAFKNGASEDLIFVPIFIGYDRVLEESAYLNELEGGQKDPENLFQVIKARKFLKKRYGKVYIKFHDPISINELMWQLGTQLDEITPKAFNQFVRSLGYRLTNAINHVAVATPQGIAASAILNFPQKRFSYKQIQAHMKTYLNYLSSQNATLADSLLIDEVRALENVLDIYTQRKFIERVSNHKSDASENPLYQVRENQRPNLEYYKNNCVSFFVPAAFTAAAILEKDAFQFSASDLHSGYAFLQDFFKYEFTYDIDHAPEYFVRKNIKAFIDDAILIPHPVLPDTYNLTSAGFRKLKLFSSFLKTYFEAYAPALHFFKTYPQNSMKSKDRLKKILTRGNRMYKVKEIERKESLSKIYYQNAIDYFTSQGIKGSENKEKIDYFVERIQIHINHI